MGRETTRRGCTATVVFRNSRTHRLDGKVVVKNWRGGPVKAPKGYDRGAYSFNVECAPAHDVGR